MSQIEAADVEEDRLAIDDDLENDSAYTSDNASYTTSLRSSILKFPEEYGRTYHAYREGRHFLPNDEKEQNRQDVHHQLMLLLLHGKLSHAPFEGDPARVIDLGTGTGSWAIDFADQHPGSHVIGNDFSPIQPTFIPPNVEFLVDDFEDDWNYEDNPFDFVHGRYMGGSVRDWPKLMRQAYENLKPGGWIELQDWDCMIDSQDGSVKPESALWRWSQLCIDRIGKIASLRPGPDLEGWVRGAGFQNVTVQRSAIPLGTWPKDEHQKRVGSLNRLQLEEGVESISIGTLSKPVMDEPAWTMEEVQVLIAQVRADFRDPNLHGLHHFYVVCGQKPTS